MNNMTRIRLMRIGAVFVALCLTASAAWAQANRVKPEVMLIVASSGTMQLNADGTDATCVAEDDPPPAASIPPTRMILVKEVLAGTRKSNTVQWCQASNPKDYDTEVHYRSMCCANVACDAYLPCGSDHGDNNGNRDNTQYDDAINIDGLIYEYRDAVKFGLMTLDGASHDNDDKDGQYSFGSEAFLVPNSIADHIGEGKLDPSRNLVDDADGENQPNLGIRSTTPQRLGPLISGNRGQVTVNTPGKGLFFDEDDVSDNLVGETDSAVRAHNTLVMDRVRGLVAHGPASISAMLHDANEYYDGQTAGVGADAGHACRRRFAILFTDGLQSSYYGGEPCVNDNDCDGGVGVCLPTLSSATHGACPCAANEDCDAGECRERMSACVYERNWPYKSPETYAEELAARGIPLFVVGFAGNAAQFADEPRARSIATSGSPGLGPDGGPGFFVVDDVDDLNAALGTIINEAEKGIVSRARPLVVAPSAIDRDARNVRQWRFGTFTEIPGANDEARYGRIVAAEYGCPAGADPDDGTSLQYLGDVNYEETLQDVRTTRRVVSYDPIVESIVGVVNASGPLFDTDGLDRVDGNREEQLRDLSRADDPKPGEDDPLRVAGRLVNGHFGRRGLPNGATGDPGPRQLGAIVEGDLVAITPPNLGVESPAYLAFAAAYQDRPTLIVGGANDGMVHVFRASDSEEIMAFMPRFGWQNLTDENSRSSVDGPLAVGELAECRKLGGANGTPECPSEVADVAYRTILVGGVGSEGANIFGIDLTKAASADGANRLTLSAVMGDATNRPYIWNLIGAAEAEVGHDGVVRQNDEEIIDGLGRSVSRPALGHVLDEPAAAAGNGEVKAAAVVGCGDDPNPASRDSDQVPANANQPLPVGRCVLVVAARDGATIRKFTYADDADLSRPMVGSPVIYPETGGATAELGFIGDSIGRLWRIDMTARDPAEWDMEIIWPPDDPNEALGYLVGRAVVDRPSLAVRDDGKLVIVFGTGAGDNGRAHMVSLTHSTLVDENGLQTFETTANWVFELSQGEYLTGAPATRGEVTYFTTVAPGGGDACVNSQARLYGIHYTDTGPVLSRGPDTFNIVPSIPQYNDAGERDGSALSILLPPGRIAYGQAIVSTPSCFDDVASTTELILNLSDESGGAAGPIQANTLRAERVQGNQVVASPVGKAGVFTKAGTTDLSICLDCDSTGNSIGGGLSGQAAPFPSVVTYWGATFSQ